MSKSRLAVDREFMYIGSAGPGPGGRAEGRADGRMGGRAGGRADGRTDGRAAGLILNDSTTIFIDVHKKQQNTLCFSVISHRTGAQVSIFIAKMKTWLRKHAKSIVFFCVFKSPERASTDFYT